MSIVECLPVDDAFRCPAASRGWAEQMSSDVVWQEICRTQWPLARPLRCQSWRSCAAQGGGHHLGRQLLDTLRWTEEAQATCPSGHGLRRFVSDAPGFLCDVCGEREAAAGATLWGCCGCEYQKCAACFRVEAAPLLVATGAANCAGDDGWSALHLAARLGFATIAERLLDAGAAVDAADPRRAYTPLMVAAAHGHTEVCEALLRRGAKKATRNRQGRTASDCARSCGRQDLEEMLA